MRSKHLSRIFVVFAVLAISVLIFNQVSIVSAAPDAQGGPGGRGSSGRGTGQGSRGAGQSVTPLTTEEEDALETAILEEYGALNLYQSVIDQLGSLYPFNTILRAEQQHVDALVRQAEKYGVTVPANPGLTSQPSFASLTEACQAGVNAETADAALYDTFKPVTTHTDLLRVYDSLQSASLNNHLPAFQTCD